MNPPYKCLFCLSQAGPFTRSEHPIPESLGNDDLILSPGFVCDPCNQYFGVAIEQKILSSPPFSVERAAGAIKTKHGQLPKHEQRDFGIYSTGYWDRVILAGDRKFIDVATQRRLYVAPRKNYGNLLARFLLKTGLELLAITDENPYSNSFDPARACARRGSKAEKWNVGYGVYPNREDLVIERRVDEYGPLETRQIYQYELGVMPSGDRVLCLAFINHCFACNLSGPDLVEYLTLFNARNCFSLQGRW